jgi:hypothetical protein
MAPLLAIRAEEREEKTNLLREGSVAATASMSAYSKVSTGQSLRLLLHTLPCAISRSNAISFDEHFRSAARWCTSGSFRCCQKSVTPKTTVAPCRAFRIDSGRSMSPYTIATPLDCQYVAAGMDLFRVTPRNLHPGRSMKVLATEEP